MTKQAEEKILAELAELKGLVMRMINPAASLDIKEKADLIRRAGELEKTDPKAARALIRQMNGGR